MKPFTTFTLFIYLTVLASCGSSTTNNTNRPEDTASAVVIEPSPPVTTSTPLTVAWIGIAARWRKSENVIFDGRYDSMNLYFEPCGRDNRILVPRDQIDFEIVTNCDTSSGPKIALITIGDSGSIRTTPILPVDRLSDDKVIMVREGKFDSVQLSTAAMERIRAVNRLEVIRGRKAAVMERVATP